ncbi:Sushi, nidogen and EGF-like domain-containing protein 1 [Lamellibrachia satsuma]|nr:Sushi, nidogen and EGF-like domain-containing protein 1 [Lamellibrachia satsuma]
MLVVGALLAETGLAISAPPHFYPFGPGKGDSMVPVSDDGSGEVTFTRSFPYYGVPRNKAWVNTNGMVSFIWDTMVLFGIPEANECVIVPFYVDMDTTKNNGRVYYRQTTNPAILRRAKRDVKRSFSGASTFNPDWVLIASFNRLTYVSGSATSPVATFQVVLITNGVQSYVMFNYGDMQFAKDILDFEYATMGLDSGDGEHYYTLPDHQKLSAADVELTTNVGVLGRWVFRVDGDTVVPGGKHPGGVYDCKKNSPCTAANRALGKYYFTYVDLSKYIQCDAFGRCMVRPCARGTFFKASISTCVHTWRYWVHHRRSMMI